jgi:hypothetical protein
MGAKQLYEGSSAGILWTDRREFYLNPNKVAELWTDVTPFTSLLMNLPSMSNLNDPKFKMFEHRSPWVKQQFQVTSEVLVASTNTASADITIKDDTTKGLAGEASNQADSSYVSLQCEVRSSTGTRKGVVLITSVESATTIKVKSLEGATIQLANDDYFIVIGNAKGEGQVAKEAWADDLKTVYNQTQIFEIPIEVTGTLYQAALKGYSNELARLRSEKMKEYKMQKERAFLFGSSPAGTGMDGTAFADGHVTDADGKIVRTTMGLIPGILKYGSSDVTSDSQNIFSINPPDFKYADFVDMMEKVFFFEGGTDKYAFCGPKAMSYWSKLDGNQYLAGKSGWKVKIGESRTNSLGFNVRTLETPHGNLHLVPTKALYGAYSSYMLCPDVNNLFRATYRADKYMANVKTENAYDGVKDVIRGDEGIGYSLIESHKLISINQAA